MTTPAYALEIGDDLSSKDVKASAMELRKVIVDQMHGEDPAHLTVRENDGTRDLILAPGLSRLLIRILAHLEKGEGVTFIPHSKQLTTQQAADILNVSRPYLIKLLESGEIDYKKTGRHRRIKASDLFEYQRKRDVERSDAMDTLLASDGDLY